jgi:hypothetical protein
MWEYSNKITEKKLVKKLIEILIVLDYTLILSAVTFLLGFKQEFARVNT